MISQEKFTIKANNVIEKSVQYAQEYGNQEITPLHLCYLIKKI